VPNISRTAAAAPRPGVDHGGVSLMVAACEDPNDVTPIINATIEWIDRLTG
jgi:hypothetical protein